MGQKRTYKQYSKEYKEEAAKSLGIASNLLYRWKDQIKKQSEGKTLSLDERSELKKLRKENKNLRMEKGLYE